MALDIQNHKMGCSFFCMTENVLDIAEDVSLHSSDMAERYIIYAGATDIFMSNRASHYLAEALSDLRTLYYDRSLCFEHVGGKTN